MRRIVILSLLLVLLTIPVHAMEFEAPQVSEFGDKYMPNNTQNFGEGLQEILQEVLYNVKPGFAETSSVCITLIIVSLLTGLFKDLTGTVNTAMTVTSTAVVCVILMRPINALIHLGADTISRISQYGKLLLPVMTAALAAQGGTTRSGTLYMTTAFFDSLLSSVISEILIPLVYFYLCISAVYSITGQPLLLNMKQFLKWLPTWVLKIVLYIFTGYISITGVVTGTTDAAMLRATKLTISGMVPVVGNILSDASEAVLVSAGLMKNAVGIYGLLAVIALWIGPFVEIGIQYLMLKIATGICSMFAQNKSTNLMADFSTAMGLLLAMTGTVCLLFLISTICFMKGVT